MEILQILQSFSSVANIPVTYFQRGEPTFRTPEFQYLPALTAAELPGLLRGCGEGVHTACVFTQELLCLGLVRVAGGETDYALFGPVSAIVCDNRRAQRILKRYGLPTTEAGLLLNFLKQTANCTLLRFADFLRLVNYTVNQETVELSQLLPEDYRLEEELVAGPSPRPALANTPHDAASYEREMYALLRFGRYPEMVNFLQNTTFTGSQGSLADNMLRHQKNMVLASATLASRYAVSGGLDYDTSMTLADYYIQRAEMAPDRNTLMVLHKNMLKTYTRMVAEKRSNNAESALVNKVRIYVEGHLTEKISGQSLAAALGLNRAYLSAQFKRETGIGLNEYVHRMKIDEASRLLVVTDMSIAAVSTRLGFSSQSYFQSIFKKVTGMNPSEYREVSVLEL